ncbi:Heat shock protein 88,97 kDa heat shock protein,Heat shock protein 105 kDa,Heat shock protein 110,Heat shock 70 kDa protein 4L,Heat shock 70 kDa protein 16,Heat shock 70 kDa protein 4 [Mytilus edulis]|uniref:Heat shock protein 88,97 kDa heat shock protein,Heat shock protein 105 kDa,Heat shock protein 110,Heat shock 70 kDa protein 4L,Heat shock 70 kDa protein 16,Heat shock 70 kDa protein 4 n=1 Tax=Mytilus edulis TaxID=6550 RepID=A0A8S3T7F8_MYTED|nr:Heat shock protein 88,97 kDa heat shock protein,Heat shock protein 105 kDa,Heat shock protein 110,Heat shock 70 kDa protein 4L,Heat shock 70 kDa protein 16,Heat shock 70 kDa protein 4 [Mytilus edulis]
MVLDQNTETCIHITRHKHLELNGLYLSKLKRHKIKAFVSFNEKNRSIGVSAKNQCITNLKNTVSVFKRFIGRKFTDPFVQQELADFPKPYKVEQGKNGEILIKVQYLEGEQQFTPEQMMAALLTKLKQISEAGLKTKVVDVVVSVPTFFTDIERRAMLNSCEVAGLNCMKVMNDSTAAALGYGIYKQDLPAETEKAKNVVFVDIGYCSLQVAIVAFHKTKLKILVGEMQQQQLTMWYNVTQQSRMLSNICDIDKVSKISTTNLKNCN